MAKAKGLIGIVVLFSIGICTYFFFKTDSQPDYEIITAKQRPFQFEISANGVIRPKVHLMVKPPLQGRIDKVLVKEGDRVRRRQLIAWMSSRDRAALLDSAAQEGPTELRRWKDIYKPSPIMAPVEGQITSLQMSRGQMVSTNESLAEITDQFFIEVNVDEMDLKNVFVGQKTKIIADSYPDLQVDGKVEHIGYQAVVENNVSIFKVLVRPTNKPDKFRLGMSAQVHFVVKSTESAIVVPTWVAGGKENGEVLLTIQDENGQRQKRKVLLGASNGKWIEVLDNLKPEEKILYVRNRVIDRDKSFKLLRRKHN